MTFEERADPTRVTLQVDPPVTPCSQVHRRKHGFRNKAGTTGSGERLVSSRSSDLNSGRSEDSQPELGSDVPEQDFGLDSKFFRRFLKIHKLLFISGLSIASLLFYFLMAVCLLEQFVIYQVGLVPSKYYKVLGERDLPGFWDHTLIALGIIIAVSFVKSTKQFIQKLLSASWRQILCQGLHRLYFADIHYYQLNVLDKFVDNPDQRITQDVDKFTSTYCDILPKLLISPFVIAYYSYQAFTKAGWYGPMSCFGFFLIGSLVNKLAMSPVVRYFVEQEKREGDFRFMHMMVRVNAESIALHDASCHEAVRTNEALDQLIRVQHRLYFRQYLLNICVNLFDYLGSILSYLVLAIPIFGGVYNSETPGDLSVIISQNSFVNMYLIYQFSQLVDLSIQFTDIAGVSHRIAQLVERLEILDVFWKDVFPDEPFLTDFSVFNNYRNDVIEGKHEQEKKLLPAWVLEKVSYSPPFRDEPLVYDLDLTINVGESILIVGGSSAGKSSLFRILRGLWPPLEGTVRKYFPPGPEMVYYCPQKPYLTVGTLREQICFPLTPTNEPGNLRDAEEKVIIGYLKMVKLTALLDRVGGIDIPTSWSVYESLSPGEIQRLCFLRVFHHRPLVALLDEATSALPTDMEELLYQECSQLGITTISIAHRVSIRKYHQKLLTLDSTGGWSLEDI